MTEGAVAHGAYQGARGAFSEDAARALLGDRATLLACETLDDVFAAVSGRRAASAVVPIENSLAGPVPGCADLIHAHDVHVVAERVERIAHALIAPPGVPPAAIRRVYSHPVAIAQCERFFRARPAVVPVASFDTAGAVRDMMAGRWTDAAAIASRRAAHEYGAVVLAGAIQDRADNVTRFLQLVPGPAPRDFESGRKTSVVCVLPNEPGALARALAPFGDRHLSLCHIESRPTRETPFEYRFHFDIGPAADPSMLADALADLGRLSRSMRVVGHYQVTEAPPSKAS